MNIDSIKNGFVIDHIPAGKGIEIYRLLKLDELDCSVAFIKNVGSAKMGKKDIIKVDSELSFNMDILGFIDPGITVNVIRNGDIIEKKSMKLPEEIVNVIKCKNPRCITTTEQELKQIFRLTDRESRVYRCFYCESKAK